MVRYSLSVAIIFNIFFCFAQAAFADSSAAKGTSRFQVEGIAAFSKKVERILAAKGARVFLIARVGRSQSDLPEGVRYTHTAFGVYSSVEHEDGSHVPTYAMHNLY